MRRFVHSPSLDRADSRDGVAPQGLDFGPSELPPLAGEQVPQREFADTDPLELVHLVPEPRQHATDLPILALVEDHFEDCALLVLRADLDPFGMHLALSESDAPADFVEQLLRWHSRHLDQIFLLHAIPRVGEQVREGAVVGDEDHPFAHAIEPADGKQPLFTGHEIDHPGPARGVEVGGHHADRLVEHVDDPLRIGQSLAVDPHLGLEWIDSRPQLCDDLPVDLDATRSDQLLAGSPTAESRCGEHLLEPLEPVVD